MPVTPRNEQKPRLNRFSETVTYNQFTDGGGTSGTYQLAGTVPAGATFAQLMVNVVTGFTGDTTAVYTVGDGSDVDRYNTGTPSCLAAANPATSGIPSGVREHVTAIRPTITVTGGADFTSIAAGKMVVTAFWYEGGTG